MKAVVLENDAFLLFFLVFQMVAPEAVPRLFIILLCGGRFKFQLFRQERVAVDLPVRVRHRDADHIAAVFKDEDVFDLRVGAHGVEPLAPEIDELCHVLVGKLRQRDRVPGRVENHFALAVGRARFEKVRGNVVRRGRVLPQGREIVVVLHHFILRNISGRRAERAPVLRHLRPILPV